MTIDFTKQQIQILLQIINTSNWKGEGVEIAVELKKKLTNQDNATEKTSSTPPKDSTSVSG